MAIVDGLDGPVVIATRQIMQLMTQALTHITESPTRRAAEDIVVTRTSPYTDVVSQACRGIVAVVVDGQPRELDLIAVVKAGRILRHRWVLVRIEETGQIVVDDSTRNCGDAPFAAGRYQVEIAVVIYIDQCGRAEVEKTHYGRIDRFEQHGLLRIAATERVFVDAQNGFGAIVADDH